MADKLIALLTNLATGRLVIVAIVAVDVGKNAYTTIRKDVGETFHEK
jgi:hypothetical protein